MCLLSPWCLTPPHVLTAAPDATAAAQGLRCAVQHCMGDAATLVAAFALAGLVGSQGHVHAFLADPPLPALQAQAQEWAHSHCGYQQSNISFVPAPLQPCYQAAAGQGTTGNTRDQQSAPSGQAPGGLGDHRPGSNGRSTNGGGRASMSISSNSSGSNSQDGTSPSGGPEHREAQEQEALAPEGQDPNASSAAGPARQNLEGGAGGGARSTGEGEGSEGGGAQRGAGGSKSGQASDDAGAGGRSRRASMDMSQASSSSAGSGGSGRAAVGFDLCLLARSSWWVRDYCSFRS